MITCADFADLLGPYASGELPRERRKAAAAHLAGCPACSDQLLRYQQTMDLVRRLPDEPPPPGLLERLREAAKDLPRTGSPDE